MNRFTIVILLVCLGLTHALTTSAQPVSTLYSFAKGPTNPRGSLTLGPDGSFYGTTESGGQNGDGTVFRVTASGTLTTLASFNGYPDGSEPYAGLTLGADGAFYGTTLGGGTNILSGGTNNTGTIFRVTTNGTLTTIVNFTGANGGHPQSRLIIGPDGSFYGTAAYGGINNDGTVFRMTTNGVLTTLVSFNGTNGAMPQAGLALGLDGNFYGTTVSGGTSSNGTIFQVTPGGSLTTLVNFNGTNGAAPYGQLIRGTDGDFYGTTAFGGNPNNDYSGGTVFRVTATGEFTKLIYFSAFESASFVGTNGESSYGQLIQGTDGSFYGTTSTGGANGSGTVFQVTTNGTLSQLTNLPNFQYILVTNFQGAVYLNYTTNNWTNESVVLDLNGSVTKLYDFPPLVNSSNSTGADSQSGLTLGLDGNLYGAIYKGGANGYGEVTRFTTNGTATAIATFDGNTGINPHAGLTLGPDGSFYGTTQGGGVNNYGTVFKLSADGIFNILVNFDYRVSGANPYAGLTLGPDGNFYGTVSGGGTNLLQTGPSTYDAVSDGAVFRLTTNGVFTPLVFFNGTNGANPYAPLLLGNDGNFYGTTTYGGSTSNGTVFQMTTNGALNVLASFTGTNGANPYGGLILGPGGNLYGMTSAGGTYNQGTVFAISTQGILNTVLNFDGTNGTAPQAELLWNSDGDFYGTTFGNFFATSPARYGTVFKLTPDGTLTTLVNFAQTNGSLPSGDLIKGPDGNFYGTTAGGGPLSNGTVFRMTPDGILTTLVYFTTNTGNWSFSSLILVTNGDSIHLDGTTFEGGSGGGGTIYQVNMTTQYAVPENTANLLNPLTNDLLWTTGGSLNLISASTTNGTATISGSKILVLPATNFSGPATLAYTFTDGTGRTNTSLIALLVTNTPPVVNPDLGMVGENSVATPLSPLANDLVETSGGTLGLVKVSTTNGTALISGTNILFTPATNYVGMVTIKYTATDHIGGTNSSYITIQVTNAAPVANPQSVTTAENTAAAITLTGTDPNHLALTYAVVAGPANGSLSGLDTNTGAVTYQPGTNYSGADSFTFRVTDGQVASSPATVSITVTATAITNPPPVANPDAYSITENTTNTFSPLANDHALVPGATLSLVSVSATNGTAMISGANVIFTPSLDFLGTATIGYTIMDSVGGASSSLITVTVTNLASADLSLSGSVTNVTAQTTLLYSLTVSNAGPSAATGVVVSNQIPAGTTFISATVGTVTTNDGILLVNIGALAVGATNLVQIEISTNGAPFTNTFQVFANENDPVPTNNSIALAALAVSSTTSTSEVSYETLLGTNVIQQSNTFSTELIARAENGTVVFDHTFTSAFADPAVQAAITQAAAALTNSGDSSYTGPTQTSFSNALVNTSSGITASTNANVSFATNTYIGPTNILIGDLGTYLRFATNGNYTGPTGGSPQSFAILAGGEDIDTLATSTLTVLQTTNITNTYLNSSVYVMTGIVAQADLSLSASASPEPVAAGSNLVYSLTVSNAGPSAATGVIISNRLLAGVTFVSASGGATPSGGSLLINLGSLAVGATNFAQVIVRPTLAGLFTNQFRVIASQADPVRTNNVASVVSTVTNVPPPPVDLVLSLVAAPNPVAVGSPLTYSLTVTNNSSTTVTGVVVSNTLPAGVTLFSLLPSQGSASNDAGVITYSVGSLSNGGAATLAIVVLPNTAGLLTNTAFVSSAQTDSQPANNRVTNVTTAITVPITNLGLTVLTTLALNPQTGLFEQSVEVANGGPATPASVLVEVGGLTADVKLYNATGTTNGQPYVQSAAPLGAGTNVIFLLEYYVPTRVMPTNLVYTVVAGPAFIPPIINGTVMNIDRMVVLANGNVLVEFSAIPGQVYAIQYSSDMVTWQTAVPVITAPATKVQWIDAGPPQTASNPSSQPARYYRVVLLPAK